MRAPITLRCEAAQDLDRYRRTYGHDPGCPLVSPFAHEPGCCRLCGAPATGRWCSETCREAFRANHTWQAASLAARARDGHACVRCGSRRSLQVNHRNPLAGSGYGRGCAHHLAGLETLCISCHARETTRQGRERWERRLPARYRRLTRSPGLWVRPR